MRLMAVAAVTIALAACGGGGEAGQFAAANSDLSEAQIGAALGPADQSAVQDAIRGGEAANGADEPPANSVTGKESQ